MEILYSRLVQNFDFFVDSYLFLLEQNCYTYFSINQQAKEELKKVYDYLSDKKIDPVLYLSYVFTQKNIILLKDILRWVDVFSYTKVVYPIENFQKIIDESVFNLRMWKDSRTTFYKLYDTDLRLVIFDTEIRYRIRNKLYLDYSIGEMRRLNKMFSMIKNAKMTINMLKKEWIPLLYENQFR